MKNVDTCCTCNKFTKNAVFYEDKTILLCDKCQKIIDSGYQTLCLFFKEHDDDKMSVSFVDAMICDTRIVESYLIDEYDEFDFEENYILFEKPEVYYDLVNFQRLLPSCSSSSGDFWMDEPPIERICPDCGNTLQLDVDKMYKCGDCGCKQR